MAAQLPPGVDLSTIPIGPPPPGVQSNFVDPYSAAPAATAVIAILIVLQVVFVSIRLYGNIKSFHNLAIDDCEFECFSSSFGGADLDIQIVRS